MSTNRDDKPAVTYGPALQWDVQANAEGTIFLPGLYWDVTRDCATVDNPSGGGTQPLWLEDDGTLWMNQGPNWRLTCFHRNDDPRACRARRPSRTTSGGCRAALQPENCPRRSDSGRSPRRVHRTRVPNVFALERAAEMLRPREPDSLGPGVDRGEDFVGDVSDRDVGHRARPATSDEVSSVHCRLRRIGAVATASAGSARCPIGVGDGWMWKTRVPGAAHASDRFERWSYFADRPFDRDRLGDMVKRTLPASLHRCKGPVNTTTTAEPCVLQVVGRRCELTPRSASPPARGRISRIVAIGRDMDTDELDELFAGCLATH